MSLQRHAIRVVFASAVALVTVVGLGAQSSATQGTQRPTQTPTPTTTPKPTSTPSGSTAPAPVGGVTLPSDYVIGPDDQLAVNFWRDKDMSADVVVRPDGKITLPLIGDLLASGLTPEQLGATITKASMKYLNEEPSVSVIVKQINSRVVYINGQVGKTGPYQLHPHMTVVQLIALAGGLQEYADRSHIQIVRVENGQTKTYWFNYKDFSKGKPAALKQNIELKIGDTVIVP